MMTMTTTRETLVDDIAQLTTYRRNLRSEALRTVDAKSRDDRNAEIARVTKQLARMYDRLDASETAETAACINDAIHGERWEATGE